MTEDNKTLLVIDDSKSIRTLMRIFLRKFNLNAMFAQDGVEALEMLEKQTPDLVLLDLMMPRMDGLTFLDHLDAKDETREIPRIIMSGRRDEESLKCGLERGVAAYLVKPISMPKLEELVSQWLDTGSFVPDKVDS